MKRSGGSRAAVRRYIRASGEAVWRYIRAITVAEQKSAVSELFQSFHEFCRGANNV